MPFLGDCPENWIRNQGVLVEVKPTGSFPCPIAEEIDRAEVPPQFEPMIVGYRIPVPGSVETADGYAIGWMRGNPRPWQCRRGKFGKPIWGDAIVQKFARSRYMPDEPAADFIGLYCSKDYLLSADPGQEPDPQDHWRAGSSGSDRINRNGDDLVYWGLTEIRDDRLGGCVFEVPTGDGSTSEHRSCHSRLIPLWRTAGNHVQWRGPQAVASR